MSAPTRTVLAQLRLVPRVPLAKRFATSPPTSETEPWPQRTPLGDYYTSILHDPIPYAFSHKPEEPPSTADPSVRPRQKRPIPAPAKTQPPPPPQTAQEKARLIFGSRLLGPAEKANKLALKQAKSSYVAGVLVPPRPEEPDNCCMSGCVNCVWDMYREDMEEWSAKKNESLLRLESSGGILDAAVGGPEASRPSMVDSKIAKDLWDDEVYQGVPVGIKEFMKQEKRLKEKHAREGTLGG